MSRLSRDLSIANITALKKEKSCCHSSDITEFLCNPRGQCTVASCGSHFCFHFLRLLTRSEFWGLHLWDLAYGLGNSLEGLQALNLQAPSTSPLGSWENLDSYLCLVLALQIQREGVYWTRLSLPKYSDPPGALSSHSPELVYDALWVSAFSTQDGK